jgi:hypothetical protein
LNDRIWPQKLPLPWPGARMLKINNVYWPCGWLPEDK